MKIVGLTGGIGTGKSTVSKQLRDFGVGVVDCDLIAREVVLPGRPAYKQIVTAFGSEILQEDGTIDRPKLGSIVFSNAEKRRKINSITHYYIILEILWQILCHFWKGTKIVAIDAPLLFESGRLELICWNTILVYCPEATQRERVVKRDGLQVHEVDARIRAQIPIEAKRSRATHILENTGTVDFLFTQTKALVSRVSQPNHSFWIYTKNTAFSLVASLTAFIAYPIYRWKQ